MSGVDLPYSEPVRLHQIGAGLKRTLEPDAETRARIARTLDLASLDRLTAEINLRPDAVGWRLDGRLVADLAQTCGITLEPLPTTIDEAFSATFAEAADGDAEEVVVSLDDESPDQVENGQIDLGQVVVEQLALRLDPFPRKPGAEFVQPEEPAEISPFAALKALRPREDG